MAICEAKARKTLTAPYMHNGIVPSLAEACRVMASAQLDVELTAEHASEMVAFLGLQSLNEIHCIQWSRNAPVCA